MKAETFTGADKNGGNGEVVSCKGGTKLFSPAEDTRNHISDHNDWFWRLLLYYYFCLQREKKITWLPSVVLSPINFSEYSRKVKRM